MCSGIKEHVTCRPPQRGESTSGTSVIRFVYETALHHSLAVGFGINAMARARLTHRLLLEHFATLTRAKLTPNPN